VVNLDVSPEKDVSEAIEELGRIPAVRTVSLVRL
jgi:hypothetical protein